MSADHAGGESPSLSLEGEYEDRMFEKVVEALDFGMIFRLLRTEYQRGRDDYRDELLGKMDAIRALADPKAIPQARIAAVVPAPAKPEKHISDSAAVRQRAPKGDRGDTSSPRPEGLPTTFKMIASILDKCPGLTAQEVGVKIRERWWPGMDFKRIGPEFSTWIRKGRLLRDDDGHLTLAPHGRKVAFPAGLDPNQSQAPARAPPAVQPTPHRVDVPAGEEKFEHLGKTILLVPREYLLATRLRIAIGKGHISTQFLAEIALGMKRHVDNETLIRDIVDGMNPKLQEVGLQVAFYKGFGFIMRELVP